MYVYGAISLRSTDPFPLFVSDLCRGEAGTLQRAIKIADYSNVLPCSCVSRKAVCGPETMELYGIGIYSV